MPAFETTMSIRQRKHRRTVRPTIDSPRARWPAPQPQHRRARPPRRCAGEIEIGCDDARAFGDERSRDGAADSTGGSCDQRDRALKLARRRRE